MVVAAGRDERRLVAHPLHDVEAEDVAVKGERTVDVGDLQVHVADVDSRVDVHPPDTSGSNLLPRVVGRAGEPQSSPARSPVITGPRASTRRKPQRRSRRGPATEPES